MAATVLDLDLLATFLEIYRSGSLSAAAARCGLSQPAVSGQLARLERHLDEILFVRSPRGVTATPQAHALALRVGAHLDQLRNALDVGESGPIPGGTVRLDATLPHGAENYRTLRFPWRGRPTDSPAAVVRGSTMYASWNGATDVAAWKVEPGGSPISRRGFETALPLPPGARSVRAVALDARGRVLGRSPVRARRARSSFPSL